MVNRRLNLWNSLLGWSSILLAGVIYAVLTLSPRIVLSDALSREHNASRQRLHQLFEQTQQMERAVETLENDPRLLEEIARSEWRVELTSEETIGVAPELQAGLSHVVRLPNVEAAAAPAYIVWLRAVSSNESLRGKLMLAAIALSLIAILSAPRERRAIASE